MANNYDFSGWATRNDLLCGDGRTIRKNAFKNQDGCEVPLIWNHNHTDPDAVLGHALLENRDDGVYAYCKFNETESGQHAKKLVMHGDVRSLSIWANKLKQMGNDVIHGTIRELSLVLAGANPGAYIDFIMAHGDEEGDAAIINYDENALVVLCHSDDEKGEETVAEEIKQPETQPEAEEIKHSDAETKAEEKGDKTIKDVLATFNEEQMTVLHALIGTVLEENEKGDDDDMKHNAFDQEEIKMENVLSHSEMKEILEDAKRCGSLKEAVISHGIEDLDLLNPDYKALNNEPEFIKRKDDWVAKVLGGVHHSPFSRIKTIFADITAAQARAKGYQKGNLKIEEVFKLLKRVTNPTTIYKKQKLDRDDIIDIDFNYLPWLKREIRMMLDEEIARAILIGDGRDPVEEADDKIDEDCIRPIWKMEDLFTVKVPVTIAAGATADDKARAFIRNCIKSRKQYEGSGNPAMFMSEDMLTDCLLLEDKNGRVIYETVDKLKSVLRVSEIVAVPLMEGLTRTDDEGKTFELAALYVNLKDYNVGTDKGGEINFFDDFDIDYNQFKYLMETRMSGSLIKPHSAVALEFTVAQA